MPFWEAYQSNHILKLKKTLHEFNTGVIGYKMNED
jgi:hypothetical protein